MKVLYPCDNPLNATNPYVRSLVEELKHTYQDFECSYGIDRFWSDALYGYDIVHIMWPEALLRGTSSSRHTSSELEWRLDDYKKQGGIVVSTCHNLVPHYVDEKDYINAYQVVYKYSDCIFHLGEYSLNLFRTNYKESLNILLPHHVYDTIYKYIPSHNEAKRVLKLKDSWQYILCLGAFRSKEERDMIRQLSGVLKGKKIAILAPSFMFVPKRRNFLKMLIPLAKYLHSSVRYPNIIKQIGLVSDQMLPYYCSACDLFLIQRVKILNSGNLPMGFYFGKVVAGPDIGNVGSLLKGNHNPVFDVMDVSDSLPRAVKEGLRLSQTSMGLKNREWAMSHWSTSEICSKLHDCYSRLLNGRKLNNERGK